MKLKNERENLRTQHYKADKQQWHFKFNWLV